MYSEKWKKELFTIPNLLSIFRLTLIPVYVALYLKARDTLDYILAGSVLTLSCLTDMADGILARKLHQITNAGKILDPLADKFTQFALILCLSSRYPMLYPVLALFLAKELFQCGALVFFVQKGKVLPGALPAGKICTTVLFVSLILLVLFPGLHPSLVLILTLINGLFLLYSFGSYLMAYFGSRNCLMDLNKD